MRIGILTLPLHTNYGGILQAYALQTVLERMGHEVKVLDKKQHHSYPIGLKAIKIYSGRIVGKYLKRRKICINEEYLYNKTYPIVSKYTQAFINKNINDFVFDNLNRLKEETFDAIVVGSDQIWRVSYYHPIENAFLSFAKKWSIKRIAYAASFGTTQWEYSKRQTEECRKLVNIFDGISVREDSGVELCEKYFGIKACHVLDPTMLLETEDYRSLVTCDSLEPNGKILNYVLDNSETFETIVNQIATIQGKELLRINSRFEEYSAPIEERIQPPVESWLAGFIKSDYVVTDSFHACIFSILFRKNFVVIGNKKRGLDRFHSLLRLFGLSNRLIETIEEYEEIKDIHIDYDKVYIKLNEYRLFSMSFLKNCLK